MNDESQIERLFEQRRARRRRMARLSFEEKIEIIERLRELQHNRSLMPARPVGEQSDESAKPKRMTHP